MKPAAANKQAACSQIYNLQSTIYNSSPRRSTIWTNKPNLINSFIWILKIRVIRGCFKFGKTKPFSKTATPCKAGTYDFRSLTIAKKQTHFELAFWAEPPQIETKINLLSPVNPVFKNLSRSFSDVAPKWITARFAQPNRWRAVGNYSGLWRSPICQSIDRKS